MQQKPSSVSHTAQQLAELLSANNFQGFIEKLKSINFPNSEAFLQFFKTIVDSKRSLSLFNVMVSKITGPIFQDVLKAISLPEKENLIIQLCSELIEATSEIDTYDEMNTSQFLASISKLDTLQELFLLHLKHKEEELFLKQKVIGGRYQDQNVITLLRENSPFIISLLKQISTSNFLYIIDSVRDEITNTEIEKYIYERLNSEGHPDADLYNRSAKKEEEFDFGQDWDEQIEEEKRTTPFSFSEQDWEAFIPPLAPALVSRKKQKTAGEEEKRTAPFSFSEQDWEAFIPPLAPALVLHKKQKTATEEKYTKTKKVRKSKQKPKKTHNSDFFCAKFPLLKDNGEITLKKPAKQQTYYIWGLQCFSALCGSNYHNPHKKIKEPEDYIRTLKTRMKKEKLDLLEQQQNIFGWLNYAKQFSDKDESGEITTKYQTILERLIEFFPISLASLLEPFEIEKIISLIDQLQEHNPGHYITIGNTFLKEHYRHNNKVRRRFGLQDELTTKREEELADTMSQLSLERKQQEAKSRSPQNLRSQHKAAIQVKLPDPYAFAQVSSSSSSRPFLQLSSTVKMEDPYATQLNSSSSSSRPFLQLSLPTVKLEDPYATQQNNSSNSSKPFLQLSSTSTVKLEDPYATLSPPFPQLSSSTDECQMEWEDDPYAFPQNSSSSTAVTFPPAMSSSLDNLTLEGFIPKKPKKVHSPPLLEANALTSNFSFFSGSTLVGASFPVTSDAKPVLTPAVGIRSIFAEADNESLNLNRKKGKRKSTIPSIERPEAEEAIAHSSHSLIQDRLNAPKSVITTRIENSNSASHTTTQTRTDLTSFSFGAGVSQLFSPTISKDAELGDVSDFQFEDFEFSVHK